MTIGGKSLHDFKEVAIYHHVAVRDDEFNELLVDAPVVEAAVFSTRCPFCLHSSPLQLALLARR